MSAKRIGIGDIETVELKRGHAAYKRDESFDPMLSDLPALLCCGNGGITNRSSELGC
jgi:hypothetical protein